MKILVTGGAGFIGSHLLNLLAQDESMSVVVIDNLSTGSRNHVPEKIKLICADIRDKKIEKIFAEEKFDAVIHLAAQTMVPYSLKFPLEDCDINLMGLINILECCRKYAVKSIVFSSSAAVYGDNNNIPLKENEHLMPTSFYGLTKLTSEHYLRIYHDLYGLNTVALRFANVYGERQGEGGEGGVISIFCKLLAQGKGITIFGDGTQTRDFIYAGDVAQALKAAIKVKGFNVINISTQKETSLNDLVKAFASAADKDIDVTYSEMREGDIYRSVLNNERCRNLLGFTPQMQLSEGVKRTYMDYFNKIKEVVYETD